MRMRNGLKSLRQLVFGMPAIPLCTVNPVVSGTIGNGNTASTTNGTFTNSPTSYHYQWYRLPSAGGPIAVGTDANTWSQSGLLSGDDVYCVVQAVNGAWSGYGTSNSIGPLAAGSTLSAPAIGYPSPLAANPTSIIIPIPADWQAGVDALKIALSASSAMTSPTILRYPATAGTYLSNADIAAGTISIGLPTFAALTYIDAYGEHLGVDSVNKSNIVTWGDTAAPVITTSGTQSVYETVQLAVSLAATDTGGVPAQVSDGTIPGWYLSGVDQLQGQIAIVSGVPTVEWYGNGVRSYGSPSNYPPNSANPYNFQITAIDYGGNKSTPLAMAVTVNAINQTPSNSTPWFTNVTNDTLSNPETSGLITLTGVSPGFNIPIQVSGSGFQYSINGGPWTNATGATDHFQNGQTLQLRGSSSSSYSTTLTCTVTVGNPTNTTQTWSITTENNPALVGFTASSSQAPLQTTTQTTYTFTGVDFQAGYGVAYLRPFNGSVNCSSVTIDGVACTRVAVQGSGAGEQSVWVTNTALSAGSYSVVVTASASTNQCGILTGTLSNTSTPLSPTSTASRANAVSSGHAMQTTSALTVPTNGIGISFSKWNTTPYTPSSGTDLATNWSLVGMITELITAGSWTPTYTSGSDNTGAILAVTWGP